MKKLDINPTQFEKNYNSLKDIWESSEDIFINIETLYRFQINNIVSFLLKQIPDEFAYILLSEIAELDNLEIHLAKEIFLVGDVACKVAICLRNDLNTELEVMCNTCKHKIVQEHFYYK